ncbi:hypothetical protein GCM10007879_06910 [Maritalea porphyrae]|uniref:Uncharacterized protein n=1 Tax=Maritalea porphyrae TaxID=880732 RepID=A0ABQ5UP43_9HYPH|nr:hypothetical protein GCM10007879_06910 [Maritalea porphyrae]
MQDEANPFAFDGKFVVIFLYEQNHKPTEQSNYKPVRSNESWQGESFEIRIGRRYVFEFEVQKVD